jgi:hypothetical protein
VSTSGGDPGGLSVTLQASNVELCPGECTEVSAAAHGGNTPYTYMWDHGLSDGPGPNQVCPMADTTYGVKAHDTPIVIPDAKTATQSLEASTSIDIHVKPTCNPTTGP